MAKTKKKDKKKSKLSDKQILKLLKALKPQTQQIVRVNVGDKADKKKGNVQSSYNPPFVFPSQQYPAIVSAAPAVPPVDKNALVPTVIREAASWSSQPLPMSQQPQLQPLISEVPLLTEGETEGEFLIKRKPRRSKKREEEAAQGYSVKTVPEPRFKSRETKNSSLGRDSSVSYSASAPAPELGGYSYINAPAQNDRFLQVEIIEDPASDQIGNAAQPLTSDEWTGTPEGVEPSIVEAAPPVEAAPVEAAPVEAAPVEEPLQTVPAPEETFVGRPIGSQSAVDKIRNIPNVSAFGEEEPDWTQNVKLDEVLPPTPPEKPKTKVYDEKIIKQAPEISSFGIRKTLDEAILNTGYDGVPGIYLSSRGSKKGQLKSGISLDILKKLYDDYLNS